MPPTPPPSPIDVFVHSGAPEWWTILAALGPLVIFLTALIAAYFSWRTLKQRTAADALTLEQKREADAKALEQKRQADDRSEWWRRAQWALDRALDEDRATKALGLVTLEVLARSELARTEELELFDLAWQSVVGPAGRVPDNPSPAEKPESEVMTDVMAQVAARLEEFHASFEARRAESLANLPPMSRLRRWLYSAWDWILDLPIIFKRVEDPFKWQSEMDAYNVRGDNGTTKSEEEGGQ